MFLLNFVLLIHTAYLATLKVLYGEMSVLFTYIIFSPRGHGRRLISWLKPAQRWFVGLAKPVPDSGYRLNQTEKSLPGSSLDRQFDYALSVRISIL